MAGFSAPSSGDQAAIAEVYERYKVPVLQVIRARLDHRLRRIFDSDDFVQDAFHTAFGRKLYAENFTSPEAFVAWLRKIAENKVRDAADKHLGSEPPGSPVQVYLRVRVRDQAGNESVAISTTPEFLDLTEPEGALIGVHVK